MLLGIVEILGILEREKIESGVALYVFLRKPQKATYLLLRTAARL